MKDNNLKNEVGPEGEDDKNLDQKIIELLQSIDHAPKGQSETDAVITSIDLTKKRIPFWDYVVVLIALMLIIGIGIMINVMG